MFRRFIFVLVFALLVAAGQAQVYQTTSGASAGVTTPPPTFQSAKELAGRGRLDKAMAQLNQLAAQTPEPAGVERLRGIIFYQKEQFPEAIEAFTKATAQDPTDRTSLEMHGVSLFRIGHATEAIPFLEKARAAVENANIDPDYVLALCYARTQRYDDSRHAFAAQFGFAPDSPQAYLLAGRMFLRQELRDEAKVEASEALALNPNLPLAHELLGEAALAGGDLTDAVQEFEAERKINPLNAALYERLGDAYLRNTQYTEAQQALNRAVLLEPNSTGPYILLGETFLRLRQPIEALQYLDHAVNMDPSNHLTHILLGQAYRDTGQLAEAKREFQTGVELEQQNRPGQAGK